jgi:hypothetical protein
MTQTRATQDPQPSPRMPLTWVTGLGAFLFLVVLEFELRALHLLGKCFTYHLIHVPSPQYF